MNSSGKKIILDSRGIHETLVGIAGQILARHSEDEELILIGIRTGGVFLARRLKSILEESAKIRVLLGVVDINLYRDDWTRIGAKPRVGKTELDFSIDNKRVILVDDVLFTGRTIRAAMDALTDFGRPARIELAVLADRGHRELPICADFKGLTLETKLNERVNVYFNDLGQEDQVAVENI